MSRLAQAMLILFAFVAGFFIGWEYAVVTGLATPAEQVPPPSIDHRLVDPCTDECQRGCLSPEACTTPKGAAGQADTSP